MREREREREIMKDIEEKYKDMREWEAGQAEQRNHLGALDRKAEQAQHDSIHGARATLHKSWGEAASSSSASNREAENRNMPSKTFSRPVSDEVYIRGSKIVGNWRKPLIEKIGGMTPNREANLI